MLCSLTLFNWWDTTGAAYTKPHLVTLIKLKIQKLELFLANQQVSPATMMHLFCPKGWHCAPSSRGGDI